MEPCNLHIDKLDLDIFNPRLPEELPGDDGSILKYFIEHGVLDELAYSFLENGFFEAERLIVIHNVQANGRYIVVEGNRRLAALKILHQNQSSMRILDEDPTSHQLQRLRQIPCLLADTRAEVDTYLAHRHIGGMKTWSPEARARFTRGMVDEAAKNDPAGAFKVVARRVGSNSQGIRNSYTALSILTHARDEFGLNVRYVHFERFGVWLRAMNSTDIRSYIGVGTPRDYIEVKASVNSIIESRVREVIQDLSRRPDGRGPLVGDSRWVTEYGMMLSNDRVRTVLRDTEDFEVARQLLREKSLPQRLEELCRNVNILRQDIDEAVDDDIMSELVRLVNRLYYDTRALKALIEDIYSVRD